MLDHLRLAVPVFETYTRKHGDTYSFVGDLIDLGLPCATRHVSKDENGNIITGEIYSTYESLPSSYTDMAVKFYSNSRNCLPYVELKASPLKLLQGHNVYGFDDIELGAVEMLGLLGEAYPKLHRILDLQNTEVLHLDTTFFAKVPHQSMVQPVLDYLSSCSSGHRKARSVKYNNYVTWGSDSARYLRPKAYGKFEEVKKQMSELQRQADKGNMRAKHLITIMHEQLSFANRCVRFEGRVCKTYLSKNNYPTNLWDLIKLQRNEPDLLTNLWHVVFDPILNTLKGKHMNYADDAEIKDLLKDKLKRTNANGKLTYVDAENAYKLYVFLRAKGFKEALGVYSKPTFYRHLNLLLKAGISKAHLQNMHKSPKGMVVPVVQVCHVDFSNQLPADYVKPTSRYLQVA